MNILYTFLLAVIVGVVVYIVSTLVPFLSNYAIIIAFLAFLLVLVRERL